MARTDLIAVRVAPNERRILEHLARAEKLALSSFIRRRLLLEAESRGYFAEPQRGEDVTRQSETA